MGSTYFPSNGPRRDSDRTRTQEAYQEGLLLCAGRYEIHDLYLEAMSQHGPGQWILTNSTDVAGPCPPTLWRACARAKPPALDM